jgi:hypothetical protein
MTPGRWERHPRPCSTTLGTATTTPALLSARGRDAATPATVPCTDRRQQLPRARLRTPRPMTTHSPSKPPLFKYGTRHDDKTGARAARTAANSPALHTIPPHVAKQCGMPVNHPLLGLQKEGDPPRCGDIAHGHRKNNTSRTHSFSHDIGTRSLRLGLGGHTSSLASLVAAPLQAPRCKAIQCLEHTTAGRTDPAGTRIKSRL